MNGMTAIMCRMAFNSSVRRKTWRKLAIQARNGLTIDESLGMLRDKAQSRRSPLATLFDHILLLRAGGQTFDKALDGVASSEEIQLIDSGQRTGKLPEALLMAVDLLEAKEDIRSAVVGVVAYPLFLISLCIVVLLVMSLQVIPELALITDPNRWTGMSASLYAVSSFVSSWKGIVALFIFIALCVVIAVTLPRWTGALRRQAEVLPPWSVYRMVVGSVWLFTIATLMQSGVPLHDIMHTMLQSQQISPYLQERLNAIFIQHSTGRNFGESMFESGMDFPDPDIVDELRTYATLPEFENQLLTIAKQWLTEGIAIIRQRAQIFSILSLLFIVLLVSALGMAIMDMQSQMMSIGG